MYNASIRLLCIVVFQLRLNNKYINNVSESNLSFLAHGQTQAKVMCWHMKVKREGIEY